MTFDEYLTLFSRKVKKIILSERLERVDVVFDRYFVPSIKGQTRNKRGHGLEISVRKSSQIPKNWTNFLSVGKNKEQLYSLLANKIREIAGNALVVATLCESVVSNKEIDKTTLSPCNHEEADTRVFLHVKDILRSLQGRICICASDTDVVILAISFFGQLGVTELWIEFGNGKNKRWLPIHQYVSALGAEYCIGILFWYGFTGCDTVSYFSGRPKPTARNMWKSFPAITATFDKLSNIETHSISDNDLTQLERYTILLYDRSSLLGDINICRKQLFTKKGRTIENVHPTRDALIQHIKRAFFQTNIWKQSLVSEQYIPNVEDWGWIKGNELISPMWTVLTEASKACYEIIKCGCKKGCSGNCKCKKYTLNCSELC